MYIDNVLTLLASFLETPSVSILKFGTASPVNASIKDANKMISWVIRNIVNKERNVMLSIYKTCRIISY